MNLIKLEFHHGALYIRQGLRSTVTRFPFPDHLNAIAEHKEVALAHNSCTTASALLVRPTSKLLSGKATHGIALALFLPCCSQEFPEEYTAKAISRELLVTMKYPSKRLGVNQG